MPAAPVGGHSQRAAAGSQTAGFQGAGSQPQAELHREDKNKGDNKPGEVITEL